MTIPKLCSVEQGIYSNIRKNHYQIGIFIPTMIFDISEFFPFLK